ncbi:alpha/beta hydrolase fold protein [Tanacetum coccineum]
MYQFESLKVSLGDISNEALECVGTHLKNMRDCCIWLGKEDGISDLPLDNGVRAMLIGCKKLEWLDISLYYEGLTDVGLEYIRKTCEVIGRVPKIKKAEIKVLSL